jgi:hypothetical protein
MRISFDAKVGGYLRIKFNVFLRERTTTESGKLGALLSRLETRYNSDMEFIKNAIKDIQVFTEALSNAVIEISIDNNQNHFAAVNSEQLLVHNWLDQTKIKLFPRLKKLHLQFNGQPRDALGKLFMSNSVETLIFNNIAQRIDMSIIIENFPNLNSITIGIGCSSVLNAKLALTTLPHRLKTINIEVAGLLGSDRTEISQYCASNNIVLVMH